MKWSTVFTRRRLLKFSYLRCGSYSRAALFRKNCIKLQELTSLDFDYIRAAALIRVNTATVNSIRRNVTMPSDMKTLGDRVLADSTCFQVPIYYGLLSENFNTFSQRSKRLKMVDQEIFGAARQSIWQKSGSTTVSQSPNHVFTL